MEEEAKAGQFLKQETRKGCKRAGGGIELEYFT